MFNFPIHDTGNSVYIFYLQYYGWIFADVIVYIFPHYHRSRGCTCMNKLITKVEKAD